MKGLSRLVIASTLCACCSGCQLGLLAVGNTVHMTVERATTPRIKKRFLILDAETGEPVRHPSLYVLHNFDWADDWGSSVEGDEDGIVVASLAKEYLHTVTVSAYAPGYLWRDWLYFGDARKPGNDPLDADPVRIFLYAEPAPRPAVRIPAGYVGPVLLSRAIPIYEMPFPPDFPTGQRQWWIDYEPGKEVRLPSIPPLGNSDSGGNDPPLNSFFYERIDDRDVSMPMPQPGADTEGRAVWPIGAEEPDGPWSKYISVYFVGTRDEALDEARARYARHHNGRLGFIYNGWLRTVAPDVKIYPKSPAAGVSGDRSK